MKELTLVRHAKSEWVKESIFDIDRPLSERGCEDAYIISKWYKENHKLPEMLVSSPAARAIHTAFIFCREFNMPESLVSINKELYESSASDYYNVISKIDNSVQHVMVFGHNPVITNLVNELNSDLDFENIPTCGLIHLNFNYTNWLDVISKKNGKLINQKFPKNFKQ